MAALTESSDAALILANLFSGADSSAAMSSYPSSYAAAVDAPLRKPALQPADVFAAQRPFVTFVTLERNLADFAVPGINLTVPCAPDGTSTGSATESSPPVKVAVSPAHSGGSFEHRDDPVVDYCETDAAGPDVRPAGVADATGLGVAAAGSGGRMRRTRRVAGGRAGKSGKPSYPCTVCGRIFGRSTHLRKHMYLHTGERPFKCTQPGCNKAFTSMSALKDHKDRHVDDQAYQCPHCPRSYGYRQSLFRHMAVHGFDRSAYDEVSFVYDERGKKAAVLGSDATVPAGTQDGAGQLDGESADAAVAGLDLPVV